MGFSSTADLSNRSGVSPTSFEAPKQYGLVLRMEMPVSPLGYLPEVISAALVPVKEL